MKHRAQNLLPICILLVGCATTKAPPGVDDALLSELSASSMAGVVEARAKKDAAEDGYARSQRDTQWAKQQVELARSALKVALARLEETKLAGAYAEKSGTVSQLEAAKTDHRYAKAVGDQARAQLELKKLELERARRGELLALEEMRLGKARVELTKAEAVRELDRVAARRVQPKDYKKHVRQLEDKVEKARAREKSAAAEVRKAERDFEATRRRVDELSMIRSS